MWAADGRTFLWAKTVRTEQHVEVRGLRVRFCRTLVGNVPRARRAPIAARRFASRQVGS